MASGAKLCTAVDVPPLHHLRRPTLLAFHRPKPCHPAHPLPLNLASPHEQRGIDLKKIAEQMTGSSGAELKAVCTEAGMFALRERRVHVTQVRLGAAGGWGPGLGYRSAMCLVWRGSACLQRKLQLARTHVCWLEGTFLVQPAPSSAAGS